jgi:hypothetical protein
LGARGALPRRRDGAASIADLLAEGVRHSTEALAVALPCLAAQAQEALLARQVCAEVLKLEVGPIAEFVALSSREKTNGEVAELLAPFVWALRLRAQFVGAMIAETAAVAGDVAELIGPLAVRDRVAAETAALSALCATSEEEAGPEFGELVRLLSECVGGAAL